MTRELAEKSTPQTHRHTLTLQTPHLSTFGPVGAYALPCYSKGKAVTADSWDPCRAGAASLPNLIGCSIQRLQGTQWASTSTF